MYSQSHLLQNLVAMLLLLSATLRVRIRANWNIGCWGHEVIYVVVSVHKFIDWSSHRRRFKFGIQFPHCANTRAVLSRCKDSSKFVKLHEVQKSSMDRIWKPNDVFDLELATYRVGYRDRTSFTGLLFARLQVYKTKDSDSFAYFTILTLYSLLIITRHTSSRQLLWCVLVHLEVPSSTFH